jgi:hypothetical protein
VYLSLHLGCAYLYKLYNMTFITVWVYAIIAQI